jgi:hypothetical protein
MGREDRIDVTKQLQDLLAREEMLAFFDFELELPEAKTVSGLCKVSRPKKGKARSKYVSLFFIVDTPGGEARAAVLSSLEGIQWDVLRGQLLGFEDALLLPATDVGSGDFVVSQVDLFVGEEIDLEKPYVLGQLHPAIVKAAGIISGDPVYFADPRPEQSAGAKSGDSLIDRVKRLLG